MDFDPSDSSGTDDDLPPTHQNRGIRGGRPTGNGRTAVISGMPYVRAHDDMEIQIHRLEQEAYHAIIRAFKAQSDAITWEKESLITEIRKELRVTDDEHRVLLGRVNADDVIRRIREWRQAGGGVQTGFLSNAQHVHDPVPSPTVSASRKKPKTSQSIPSLSLGGPSPALHPQTVAAPLQPSSSAAKRGAPPAGAKGKKSKPGQMLPTMSSMRCAGPAEAANFDPLIGRKVKTRWPEDNNFYEAVITDYNPVEGLHALVYDMNTKDETWEWVNLKEFSPDDIQWEGEDPGISRRVGRGGPVRGLKKTTGRGGAIQGAGRGRGSLKNHSKKDFPPSQNGIGKKGSDDIELLHTDTLIKEVERIFNSNHPDPVEIEKAKKTLKDHEQSLIDAIARLADASDGESDEGDPQFSHGQSMDKERKWRNRHPGSQRPTEYVDNMAVDGREGSDGNRMAGIGGVASDYRQDGEDDM